MQTMMLAQYHPYLPRVQNQSSMKVVAGVDCEVGCMVATNETVQQPHYQHQSTLVRLEHPAKAWHFRPRGYCIVKSSVCLSGLS